MSSRVVMRVAWRNVKVSWEDGSWVSPFSICLLGVPWTHVDSFPVSWSSKGFNCSAHGGPLGVLENSIADLERNPGSSRAALSLDELLANDLDLGLVELHCVVIVTVILGFRVGVRLKLLGVASHLRTRVTSLRELSLLPSKLSGEGAAL